MTRRRFYRLSVAGTRSGRGRRTPAFSLIELLVVVGIIVVLISILLPTLRTSIRQATSTVCAHNLKQLGQAIEMYKLDNNGWVPVTSQGGRAVSVWFQKLAPRYLNDPNLLVCPEDPFRAWLLHNDSLTTQDADSLGSSYGMNEFILGSTDQFLCNLERYSPKRPLDTLLVADMGPDYVKTNHVDPVSFDEPSRNNGVVSWHDGYVPGAPSSRPSWITKRHLGGINVLTIGGSVHQVKTREIMARRIMPFYDDCARGGCTLCVSLALPHYSFAVSQTYQTFWWTGPTPAP